MSKSASLAFVAACLFIGASTTNAHAQFWKDVVKTVEGGASAAWKATTAPYETVVNAGQVILGQKDASSIIQPYQQLANQSGQVLHTGGSVAMAPQQFLYQKAEDFASNFGDAGTFIFDVSTFSQRYYSELGYAGTQFAGNVLQGKSPMELFGLPLAGALRAARERFLSSAKPIPPDVRAALQGHFSNETLNRAKYAVGKLEITLPNMLNFVATDITNLNQHAVVVDDIIVWRYDPVSFQGDPCHWTHEMHHVDQYRQWGVEGFAWKWVNAYPVEREADQVASRITGFTCQNGNNGIGGIGGGASGTPNGNANYSAAASPSGFIPQGEFFVAQCFFYQNANPVSYMVSNFGKIYAVNVFNGQQTYVAHAIPPTRVQFNWMVAVPGQNYGVAGNGMIWAEVPQLDAWGRPMFDMYGRQIWTNMQIGHVVRYI